MKAIAGAVAITLAILSALRMYWALGGRRAPSAAIPEVTGRPTFTPGPGSTLAAAAALELAVVVVVSRAGLWTGSPLCAALGLGILWIAL